MVEERVYPNPRSHPMPVLLIIRIIAIAAPAALAISEAIAKSRR